MDPAWLAGGHSLQQGSTALAGWQHGQDHGGQPTSAQHHPSTSASSPSTQIMGGAPGGPPYAPPYTSFDVERILAASDPSQGAGTAAHGGSFPEGPLPSDPSRAFPSPYYAHPPFAAPRHLHQQNLPHPPPLPAHLVQPHLPHPPPQLPSSAAPYPAGPAYPPYPPATPSHPPHTPSQAVHHPSPGPPRSWQKRRQAQYDDRTFEAAAPAPPAVFPGGGAQPEWLAQLGQQQQRRPSGLAAPPHAGPAVFPPTAAGFAPALDPEAAGYHFPPELGLYETAMNASGAGVAPAFTGALAFPSEPSQNSPSVCAFPPSAAPPTIDPYCSRTTTFASSGSLPSRPGSAASFSSSAHFPQAPPQIPLQQPSYDFSHCPLQAPAIAPAPATSAGPPPPLPPASHRPLHPIDSPARASSFASPRVIPHPSRAPPPLNPAAAPPSAFASTTSAPVPSTSTSSSTPASDPADPAATAQFLTLASVRRLAHASLPPPLSYKPARAPDEAHDPARERRERLKREREELERGRVNRNQAGGVGSLDFVVRCGKGEGCGSASSAVDEGKGRPLARVVLRGLSPAMVEVVDAEAAKEGGGRPRRAVRTSTTARGEGDGARCWACIGKREGDAGVVRAGAPLTDAGPSSTAAAASALAAVPSVGRKRKAKAKEGASAGQKGGGSGGEANDKGYEDTLSAAIDRLEIGGKTRHGEGDGESPMGGSLRGAEEGDAGKADEEDQEWKDLLLAEEKAAEQWKGEALKCDVCSLTCGVARFFPSDLVFSASASSAASGLPDFTVEIICARCDALFKCCSDCGGGGGRLTPGRWRSQELFPDGRKTCKLSHARNPALGEILIDVLPLSPVPPPNLSSLENRCRQIYFNTRLGTIARPEFLLRGDGLARSYDEVLKVTVDHWSLMSALLGEQPDESTGVKRYLTLMYSTPRKRHAVRGNKDADSSRFSGKKSKEPEKVAFGFSISVADFNDGTLFFCCVMPWPINGQAFDAMTVLGESTTVRVKSDLRALNASRRSAGQAPYRSLTYNYLVSPFKLDSRANLGLARRGYQPIDEVEKKDSELKREWFPPLKEVWLPKQYASALQVYIRRLESDDDLGGPPPENAPRKRARKAATATTAASSAAASTPSSSASPASVQQLDYSPFASTAALPPSSSSFAYPTGMSPSLTGLPLALATPPQPATPDMVAFPPSAFYSPGPSFFDPSSSYPPPPPPPGPL
ncbi:hypothetical protein JCM6882_008117 [Rhodosporidiobolus microsporus]